MLDTDQPHQNPQDQLQDLGARAADALKQQIHTSLSKLFQSFLDKFEVTLKQACEHAKTGADKQALFELERNVRTHKQAWLEQFLEQVQMRLNGQVQDFSHKAQDTEAGNAGLISIAKALLLAETRYFKAITEIDARLNRIRLLVDVSFDAKALSPTGLHQALVHTAQILRWPEAKRTNLYEQFEHFFVADLAPIYEGLVEVLRDVGTQAASLVMDAPVKVATAPRAAKRPLMQPPEDTSKLDGDTADMLTELALSDDSSDGYSDGLLAADLLALMDKRPLPGIAKDQAWIPVQRTSLAGHYLNEVKADPVVARNEPEQHESIRMPLVKSAIADKTVFTDVSHPLNNLIDEHMIKVATQRLVNADESDRLKDSLKKVLEQFDLAPDFVREAMATAEPLGDEQIKRFYELQREQSEQRREFVIGEAKRMVAEELERSGFGRNIPKAGLEFLNKAWGPMLTKRLLQYGASHTLWQQGIAQADELIDRLEQREPKSKPSPEWLSFCKSLCENLIQAGFPEAQRGRLLKLLELARSAK